MISLRSFFQPSTGTRRGGELIDLEFYPNYFLLVLNKTREWDVQNLKVQKKGPPYYTYALNNYRRRVKSRKIITNKTKYFAPHFFYTDIIKR